MNVGLRPLARILAGRSRREQALLALLGVVALPLALLTLWVAPLREDRAAAAQALAEARALDAWVAAEAASFQAAGGVAPASAPSGLAGVEQSLAAAGLADRVERLEDASDGRVALSFAPVPFADLARYAAGIGADLGYRIVALRIEGTDRPGLVTARFELAPPG